MIHYLNSKTKCKKWELEFKIDMENVRCDGDDKFNQRT